MIEVFLSWLVRAFIVLMVLRFASTLFGGGRRAPSARGPRPSANGGAAPRAERAGGTLVRDPQCGTYLPESRAVRGGDGARTQFFCSVACRDAYAAAQSSVAS